MFYKLTIRKWIKTYFRIIENKPIVLFSVSGASSGPKLTRWISNSLPKNWISQLKHVALRGSMDPAKLSWGLRLIMKIGALINPDSQASKEEKYGFDYVDKSSIEPILSLVSELQSTSILT